MCVCVLDLVVMFRLDIQMRGGNCFTFLMRKRDSNQQKFAVIS